LQQEIFGVVGDPQALRLAALERTLNQSPQIPDRKAYQWLNFAPLQSMEEG
jgi:hypothetical protein